MPAVDWWVNVGGEVPLVQRGATQSVGHPCGADAAERNWKLYKSTVTKARSNMGKVSHKTFKDDAELDDDGEEFDSSQTTGTKMTYASGNMHSENFDDFNLSDAARELQKFDCTDMAFLDKIFDPAPAGLAPAPTADATPRDERQVFRNYIETWESDVRKKDDALQAKLRDKYLGIRVHLTEDNDADDDDDDEEMVDKIVEVVGIHWQPKRDQNFDKKGYYLEARVVKDDGRLDDSYDGKEIFGNDCHDIIHEVENPKRRFEFAVRD